MIKVFLAAWLLFSCLIVSNATSAENLCHPLDQCSCKLDDGRIISLWDIDSRSKTKPRFKFSSVAGSDVYEYNPCTGFTKSGGGCENVLACRTVENSGKTASVAIAYSNLPSVTYTDNVYKFTYTGADNAQTNIVLKCDKSAKTPSIDNMFYASKIYLTTLTSECACPGTCKWDPNSGGSSTSAKGHKLSTGSILCIVLLVLVVVYVVGGLLLNKFAFKKEGSEIIPQKSFWGDLPGLVKDGFVFTHGKVKGNKGQYEQI